MLLFLASIGSPSGLETAIEAGARNFLLSFAQWPRSVARRILEIPDCNLLVDSGAYSVWKKKRAPIKWEEYAAHCECLRDSTHQCGLRFVNLDVIPGGPGRRPTRSDVDDAARMSWANFERLRRRGLAVMPVFHQGEDFCWLDRMVGECDYVGISPTKGLNTKAHLWWLSRVFDVLEDRVRTHAFGATAPPILGNCSFYSADSTTHMNGALYKNLIYQEHPLEYRQRQAREVLAQQWSTINQLWALAWHEAGKNVSLKETVSVFLRYERGLSIAWQRYGVTWHQRFDQNGGTGSGVSGVLWHPEKKRAHDQRVADWEKSGVELIRRMLPMVSKEQLKTIRSSLPALGEGAELAVWLAYCVYSYPHEGVCIRLTNKQKRSKRLSRSKPSRRKKELALDEITGYSDITRLSRARANLRKYRWLESSSESQVRIGGRFEEDFLYPRVGVEIPRKKKYDTGPVREKLVAESGSAPMVSVGTIPEAER